MVRYRRRVYVCDNHVCRKKCSYTGKRVMLFDGQFVYKTWPEGTTYSKLKKWWEDGEIDATWWCTACHVEADTQGGNIEQVRNALGIYQLISRAKTPHWIRTFCHGIAFPFVGASSREKIIVIIRYQRDHHIHHDHYKHHHYPHHHHHYEYHHHHFTIFIIIVIIIIRSLLAEVVLAQYLSSSLSSSLS